MVFLILSERNACRRLRGYLTCLVILLTCGILHAGIPLDTTFGTGGKVIVAVTPNRDFVRRVRIAPDGKIVTLVGNETNAGISQVVRHNPDGMLDSSFGANGVIVIPGFYEGLTDFVILPTGGLICTGGIYNGLGEPSTGIIRISPNGDPQPEEYFFDEPSRRILLQADGKFVLLSISQFATGRYTIFASRYFPDGTTDTSFGFTNTMVPIIPTVQYWSEAGRDSVGDALIQPDGKIVVSGADSSGITISRLNQNGTLDTGFSGDGVAFFPSNNSIAHPTGIALQADGKIVLNGVEAEFGLYSSFILRLNADGTADDGFGTAGRVTIPEPVSDSRGIASALAIQLDGKIIIAGTRNNVFALSRYLPNGSIDLGFGADGLFTTPVGNNPNEDSILSLAWQADGKLVAAGIVRDQANVYDVGLVRYAANAELAVQDLEGLYSAVNTSTNAGRKIVVSPGVYTLSTMAPGGTARPNGGRLELQENMSLVGTAGDRGAVVIDAANLPPSSYTAPTANTGAIRIGKGTNSIEWITIRNAVNGGAGIIVHMAAPGTTSVRIAHVEATGNQRGIDIRNVGSSPQGFVINAEVVDTDLHNNRVSTSQGMRIINTQGSSTSVITASLSNNRMYNNQIGLIVENIGSTNSGLISVASTDDRFYENGGGVFIGAALGSASGNVVNFRAVNSAFENNNGTNNFYKGGLIVIGGVNSVMPNGVSGNTATAVLRNCRFGNNQIQDLGAFGASSFPESIGLPGTNNHARITLLNTQVPNLVFANSVPTHPTGMNSATVIRDPVTVSGRVLTVGSMALRNALVSLRDSQGTLRTALTNSFGLFNFEDVSSGEIYTVSVASKRYRFAPRSIQPENDVTLLDFVGLE